MAKKTNIVSFDDAKSQSRRASVSASGKRVSTAESASPAKSGTVTTATKRETRKRERTKARADKMFSQQYEGTSSSSASTASEDAPRAAVYEGKMGSTQRRSARMQRSSKAEPLSAKINPAGWFAGLTITARTLRVATVAVCFVLVCAFLYTPAQQYYQAQRENARLQAEYSIIAQRNENLDEQNDVLASDAGMEDAVRQKYGYVKAGEESAVVTGLSEQTTDSARDSEEIEPAVLSSSVKAPEEWYTPILDAFFGVA